jgi:hemerythrin
MKNALFVEWNNRYLLGIPLIDNQHKRLLDMTNQLYAGCLMGEDKAKDFFKKTIHKAVEYVKYHFSTEEKIFLLLEYPGFAIHKKEHESFINKLIQNARDFEAGKPFVPNVFVRFLRDWILTHIAISDKLYADYIFDLKKQGRLKFKETGGSQSLSALTSGAPKNTVLRTSH